MRKFVPACVALFFTVASLAQSKPVQKTKAPVAKAVSGYNIPITLTPFKNTWVYLGSHFGKYKNMADSAWLNEKSQGTFKGNKKMPQGIYFVVSPNKYLLFELLMDKEQNFTIKADTTALSNITITGS